MLHPVGKVNNTQRYLDMGRRSRLESPTKSSGSSTFSYALRTGMRLKLNRKTHIMGPPSGEFCFGEGSNLYLPPWIEPLVRLIDTGDQVQQRSLSRSRRPH